MNLYKTDAIILKIIPYKENSIIAKVFCTKGKQDFIAYGVDKLNSSLYGIVQPLNLISICYKPKDIGLVILKEAEFIKNLASSSYDILCFQYAAIELYNQLEFEDDELNFNLLFNYLEYVKMKKYSSKIIFLRFLHRLCINLGIFLEIGNCSICNSDDVSAYYLVNQEFICKQCEAKILNENLIKLQPEDLFVIFNLMDINKIIKTKFSFNNVLAVFMGHIQQAFQKNIKLNSLKSLN